MYQKRIHKVQKACAAWKVDAFIVTNPIDLFYLTGLELSSGYLFIKKKKATLVVDGRYLEKAKKSLAFDVLRLAPDVLQKLATKRVGFAAECTTYTTYQKFHGEMKAELVPLVSPMQKIRAIKEAEEIASLEQAARMVSSGYDFLCTQLRRGVSEKRLAKELEMFWIASGADKLAFEPIIAFGKNSSMPHHRAGSSILKPHDAVLVDIGVVVNGYAADMTRMLFYGKPDPRLTTIYDIVLQAQTKAIKAVKPKVSASKLYGIAKKTIDDAQYGDCFLHGLGHGIGLEVHEYPILRAENKDALLEPGMCITIEPGIYLPNIGGVRIEDMVLVTKSGHKILTSSPKAQVILPVI